MKRQGPIAGANPSKSPNVNVNVNPSTETTSATTRPGQTKSWKSVNVPSKAVTIVASAYGQKPPTSAAGAAKPIDTVNVSSDSATTQQEAPENEEEVQPPLTPVQKPPQQQKTNLGAKVTSPARTTVGTPTAAAGAKKFDGKEQLRRAIRAASVASHVVHSITPHGQHAPHTPQEHEKSRQQITNWLTHSPQARSLQDLRPGGGHGQAARSWRISSGGPAGGGHSKDDAHHRHQHGPSEEDDGPKETSGTSAAEDKVNSNLAKFTHHFKFFEVQFDMDPELVHNAEACTMFACKILGLLGFQLALLLAFVIVQLHDVFPRSDTSSFVHLALYLSLYILVRAFSCGHKYPENMLYFAFMTYMILYSFGNFEYGHFVHYVIIYMSALLCTLWSLVLYVVSIKMDVRSIRVYPIAIFLFILFSVGGSLSACMALDRPGRPFYKVLHVKYLALFFPLGLALTIVIIFELQRFLHGRRVSLLKNEWATAAMILPLSFVFPAYFLRKFQCNRRLTGGRRGRVSHVEIVETEAHVDNVESAALTPGAPITAMVAAGASKHPHPHPHGHGHGHGHAHVNFGDIPVPVHDGHDHHGHGQGQGQRGTGSKTRTHDDLV